MMNDIDSALRKMEIKKRNNKDTTEEELILVNTVMAMFPINGEETKRKKLKVEVYPLVRCREILPVYKETLQYLTDVFMALKSNGSNNTIGKKDVLYEELVEAYKKYDDITYDFFDALIDYGDFVDAETISQLEKEFIWGHRILEEKSIIDCFQYALDLLHTTTPYIEKALNDGNKGMCMTLAPYIHGCSSNMLWKIMIEEETTNEEMENRLDRNMEILFEKIPKEYL